MVTALALATLAGCAHAPHQAPDAPVALLSNAIARAGGGDALEHARALIWEGSGIVHTGPRDVRIHGTWSILPPDSAVIATYDVDLGPTSERRLIVAGPDAWIEQGGQFRAMDPAMSEAERAEYYVYSVMRLLPLRENDAQLIPITPDASGQHGFAVVREGRPTVGVYVSSTGRLAHIRLPITDPSTHEQVWQDIWLSGDITSHGVHWPRTMHITQNGAPYFDLTIEHLTVQDHLTDPYLAGPR